MSEKQFKFREPIPDLWCPFCGEQIYDNGVKNETNHYIEEKDDKISILCRVSSLKPLITMTAYYTKP